MNDELVTITYNKKEINDVAKRMYDRYGLIFVNRLVPRSAIKKIAKKLEEYPQSEDKKLFALEYAARIKYEIMNNIDYFSYETSSNPLFFDYKKIDFAPTKAITDLYEPEVEDDYPIEIKRCIEKAYYDSIKYFNNSSKKLLLNNRKGI